MTNKIDYLPIWKANATAEERLQELAHIARKHPERFHKFAIVYQELDPINHETFERQMSFNVSTIELLGLLRFGEMAVLRDTRSE